MKRTSLLGQYATSGSDDLQRPWWLDPARVVERALLIAREDPKLRESLMVGLKRPRGSPAKHSLALKMMVLDTVDYVQSQDPALSLSAAFAAALHYLPDHLEEGEVKGIYQRMRSAKKSCT